MKVFLDTADVDAIRRANLTGHRLFVTVARDATRIPTG
jgi:hypothetical protein